jgi:hypothetical protein
MYSAGDAPPHEPIKTIGHGVVPAPLFVPPRRVCAHTRVYLKCCLPCVHTPQHNDPKHAQLTLIVYAA